MSSSYNKRKRRLPEYESESGIVSRARNIVKDEVEKTKDNLFSQLLGDLGGDSQKAAESTSGKIKLHPGSSKICSILIRITALQVVCHQ